MKNIMKFLAISVMILVINGCGFVSKAFLGNSEPDIVAGDIEKMIQKARPLIQDITGHEFKKEVKFKIVSRQYLEEAIAENISPNYKKLMKGLDDDEIARQIESVSFQLSRSTFGLYSKNRNMLLIIPENIFYISKMSGGKEKDLKDSIFLIVAHEMVHMLDYQSFDLSKIEESIEDTEETSAFGALLEGHAVYVTDLVADRLNLSEKATLIQQKSAEELAALSAREQSQQMYTIYIKGSEFVEAVIREKGPSGIDAAFASPPKSTREIMNPDKYLSSYKKTTIDCLDLLERTCTRLPTDGMTIQTMSIGSMDISSLLIGKGISSEEAESISSGCLSGAVFMAAKRSLKPSSLFALAINFSDIETSERFMELSRKIEKIDEVQTNAKLNASYTVLKDEEVPFDGFNQLRYLEVEKETDGIATIEKSVEGYFETFYISTGCSNMDTIIGEKDFLDVVSSMQKEVENSF